MQQIAMLGGGFIGRFYAESLHGQRSRDRVIAIYAHTEWGFISNNVACQLK